MLRQVASIPLRAQSCLSLRCAVTYRVAQYSTQPDKSTKPEKDTKSKDKPSKPATPVTPSQSKQAAPSKASASTPAKATPSTPPANTPKPKPPVVIPKKSKPTPNPNLPSPHVAFVFENIHPVYEFSKTQEDRVVHIEDLVGYVSKQPYNNASFKDKEKIGDVKSAVGKLKEKKFSFYGVFDGHQGKYAAEYIKARLPYELVSTPEFAEGNYEAAIKKAYASVHKALLASEGYKPEAPKYDFTSGTTASIALVTPTTTYLAQLGNTPILARKQNERAPSAVFPQPAPEEVERLRTSGMFLMVNYEPISETNQKRVFWQETQNEGGDFRHGVSNINTLGSLGDSLYEPANLNRYLAAMREYRAAAEKRDTEAADSAKKLRRNGNVKGRNTNERPSEFEFFLDFVKSSPRFKDLAKHVAIGEDRDNTSWITNGLLEGTFKVPTDCTASSLTREPQVTSIPNNQLKYVNIVSDGILTSKHATDPRAMRELDLLAEREAQSSRAVMGAHFSRWVFGNYNDDLSSVIVTYQQQ